MGGSWGDPQRRSRYGWVVMWPTEKVTLWVGCDAPQTEGHSKCDQWCAPHRRSLNGWALVDPTQKVTLWVCRDGPHRESHSRGGPWRAPHRWSLYTWPVVGLTQMDTPLVARGGPHRDGHSIGRPFFINCCNPNEGERQKKHRSWKSNWGLLIQVQCTNHHAIIQTGHHYPKLLNWVTNHHAIMPTGHHYPKLLNRVTNWGPRIAGTYPWLLSLRAWMSLSISSMVATSRSHSSSLAARRRCKLSLSKMRWQWWVTMVIEQQTLYFYKVCICFPLRLFFVIFSPFCFYEVKKLSRYVCKKQNKLDTGSPRANQQPQNSFMQKTCITKGSQPSYAIDLHSEGLSAIL